MASGTIPREPSLRYHSVSYTTAIPSGGGVNVNYSFSDLGIPDDEDVMIVQVRQYHYGAQDDVYHSLFVGWTFNNSARTISIRIYSTRANSANSHFITEALSYKR